MCQTNQIKDYICRNAGSECFLAYLINWSKERSGLHLVEEAGGNYPL